jgi:LPS-assembly protein
MISRTRLIITALLLCHLFLRPALLTSQLPAGGELQNSAPTEQTSDQNLGAAAQSKATSTQTALPSSSSKSGVNVTTDTGQEDTATEDIIEQELASSGQEEQGPPRPTLNVAPGRNQVLISADEQQKNQEMYYLRGHVVIRFGTNTLHADRATYDSATGQLTATGHVVFDGGPHNEHVVGSKATYDISRDSGTFYDAKGSTGARVKNQTMFLTSSTPFFFTGKVVERLGPDHYRVHNGFVTSCQLPNPKWRLESKTANVEIGDEAQLHHATLKIGRFPVFYFPYVEHPADNLGRKSGFLIPEIGQSTYRGTILGDAFYWAIARNADATMGAEYYSKQGWAETGNFRWLGRSSAFSAQYFGVIDYKGTPDQGGSEFIANGWKQLPDGFVGTINVDYLTSYVFRLAFALGYTEAISSEARSNGFIDKTWAGYDFGIMASRYQNYESTTPGDFISIVHAPSLELSTVERPFSRSNFVYAYDLAAEGLNRSVDPGIPTSPTNFETAPIVGRLDAAPYIAWPKLFDGWTFRPEAGARETYYSQRLLPDPAVGEAGTAVSNPINRNAVNASLEVRPPTLSKIFNRKPFGRVLKHTIDPYVIYRYQTGIDNFDQIIRFDYRDILADTNEVQYGVINRLYSKKTKLSSHCYQSKEYSATAEKRTATQSASQEKACKDNSPPAANVIEWEVAQKYFMNTNFGGALVPGQRNVFDTTVDFSGIAFLTEPRSFSPVISRLRVASGNTDFQWDVDYDPVFHQVNASTIFVGYRWGNWYMNSGQTYLNAPGDFSIVNGVQTQSVYNQWRLGLNYGGMAKHGLSAGVTLGMSQDPPPLLQAATIQTNYNWDCCGLAFQYQRWALGTVRNENAYRFSFSLANVGTFGSIRRLQRIY